MISKITFYLLVCVYFTCTIFNFSKQNKPFVNGGDPFGYYLYLPAFFIHHDLSALEKSFASLKTIQNVYSPNPQNPLGLHESILTPTHHQAIKYTCGVALLNFPIFICLHFYDIFIGKSHTGFENEFAVGFQLCSLLFVFLGFYFIRQTLLKNYTDLITAITLWVIALSTNLFYLSCFQFPISHTFLFGLYSILLYATVSFYETKSRKYFFALCFSFALIVLIRPNEIYAILIPLLWNVASIQDFKQRMRFYFQEKKYGVYAILLLVGVLFPQLIYWKMVSNQWVFYSYGKEGFNFLNPQIIKGLFSFNNGFFAYTPILFFAVLFLHIDLFKQRKQAVITLYFWVHVFVIYSWWCWFYMGSFGSRPMIESYPLLALPFAGFLTLISKKMAGKILGFLLVLICTFLNVSQSFASFHNRLLSEAGSIEFCFKTCYKDHLNYDDLVLFDTKETQPKNLKKIKELAQINLKEALPNKEIFINPTNHDSFVVLTKFDILPGIWVKLKDENLTHPNWIKVSIDANAPKAPFNIYQQGCIKVEFRRNGKTVRTKELRIQNKINNSGEGIYNFNLNQWGQVSYFSKIPSVCTPEDSLKVYITLNNPDAPPLKIANFNIALWGEK